MSKYKYWLFVTGTKEGYKRYLHKLFSLPTKKESETDMGETVLWGVYLGRTDKNLSSEETLEKLKELKNNNKNYQEELKKENDK